MLIDALQRHVVLGRRLRSERFVLKAMNENNFAKVDFERKKSISRYIDARQRGALVGCQLMAETNASNRIQLNFLCIESCMDREIETSKRFCL